MDITPIVQLDAETFYEGIQLEPKARERLRQVDMDEQTYQEFKRSFYADEGAFINHVKQLDNHRLLFLYLYVRFAIDLYGQYKERGIEERIYFHTFLDIQIWCNVCFQRYGEYGIAEYHWLKEHVQLRIFRLGRLQFQPIVMDRNLEFNAGKVYEGQQVLNVHIPEGGPLDPLEVEASFTEAKLFFSNITPVFVCHSWLLYPELQQVLHPDSNVLRFARLFHIYDSDIHSRDGELRIFGQVNDEANEYPENTDMQRRVKAHLLSGQHLGSGSGIKFG